MSSPVCQSKIKKAYRTHYYDRGAKVNICSSAVTSVPTEHELYDLYVYWHFQCEASS